MIIVPIGLQCATATFRNKINPGETLPFDWMFATPKFCFEMLELLLIKNMNIADLVKNHFFLCEKKTNYKSLENYYTCDDGFALYNTKYNVIFPHDEYNDECINKYIRRFERLKELIFSSNECLYFVYSSQSSLGNGNFTIDDNIIVKDVYLYLSKIYVLISRVRKNYKLVLFDTIQEDNIQLLNKNIILYRLKKCDSWIEVVNQMLEHTSFFNEIKN